MVPSVHTCRTPVSLSPFCKGPSVVMQASVIHIVETMGVNSNLAC